MVDADSNLLAIFEVNQTNANQELLGIFQSGQGSQDLLGEFISQQADSEDLLAEFIVRRSASIELLGKLVIRRSASVELLAHFISRQAGSAELLGTIIVRHSDLQNLLGKIIVRHSDLVELLGHFISRQAGSTDLLGETVVRHTATPLNLYSRFAVRLVYPYWTDRRRINGVVTNAENLMGDAILETVMEGVMDDIKVWCDANDVSYVNWVSIDTAPRAMVRATTYGAVAALYARYSKTFQGRVVPTVAPVTITVVGDDEKAMQHWQDKMQEMLELYLSAQGSMRLWVSTADEEPVFTMADIPSEGADELESWHDWIEG